MKKIIYICWLLACVTVGVQAQVMNDVSKADGAYPAIKQSVNKGYLSLFNDDLFQPDQAISRKEAAIIINLLTKEIKSHSITLSKTELKELDHLAKTFKGTFSELDDQLQNCLKNNISIMDEQTAIRHELGDTKLELQSLQKQNRYL